MSTNIHSSTSAIDPYEFFEIVANPDGTITRYAKVQTVAAAPDPVENVAVLSKDVTINQANNVWARIYLPRQALLAKSNNKLPLIFYYQAGGLILQGVSLPHFHDFCSDIAIQVPAVVISVEYRVAPEHRLPVAYEDAIEALYWTKTTQEEWITNYADLSYCFLMGGCAGGNIAYNAGKLVAAQVENLLPLKIVGLILHQPAFSGMKRTESELRLANDRFAPLSAMDLLLELVLPIGADRDHEYSNPTVGGGSMFLDKIRLLEWKVMMIGCDGDPFFDRHVVLAKMLEQKGVQVVRHFDKGGSHGVEFRDPVRRKAMLINLKEFVRKTKDRSLFRTDLNLHSKI